MMRERQQHSTAHPMTFLMVQSGDHLTGAAGLSPAVTVSKDGAALAAPVGAVTEVGGGLYALAGDAADRDTLGEFLIHAAAAGADPSDTAYAVIGYDPFDGLRLGITAFDVAGRVSVAPAGLDAVTAEAGVNLRQAVALTLDAVLAKLSGNGGAAPLTLTVRDVNDTADRATLTVDASGNRTGLVMRPPA